MNDLQVSPCLAAGYPGNPPARKPRRRFFRGSKMANCFLICILIVIVLACLYAALKG